MALPPFLQSMLDGLVQIKDAHLVQPGIWWYLGPIIFLWFMLEIYFGTRKQEKLGWNTSLANGFTLAWISLESMRHLFEAQPDNFWIRFAIICALILYALFIAVISFTHKFSASLVFNLASPNPIYFLCYISVLWGHGALDINQWVALDLVVLYIMLIFFAAILRKLLPAAIKEFGEEPVPKLEIGGGFGPDIQSRMGGHAPPFVPPKKGADKIEPRKR
ncbi:hypothetical protein GF351_04910 [Candidatus Woesearchaeota archaeon]|nr:hypothetical protein [Candidatus Woesearchaeota archaeon]